jgi:hypothetical protein
MGLKEIGWEVVEWLHLPQYKKPMAVCCEHGNELSGSIKGGEILV